MSLKVMGMLITEFKMTNNYKTSPYRPDIDGLRAIAVLSVVFFHASKNFLRGGFVGVDIFFVISGYLITRILINHFYSSNYPLQTIISFYIKRIRRIFPILIFVLLFSAFFGCIVLTQNEFKLLGKHIASGAFYISNLVLWSENGYFDTASDFKPLLHLWSLAVEEQFYILWPFLILVFSIYECRLNTSILIFSVVSFILNIILIHYYEIGAFYCPITRFWELSLGGLVAGINIYNKELKNDFISWLGKFLKKYIFFKNIYNETQIGKNFISCLGLLLIIYAIVSYRSNLNFPGFWALIPTFGTCLIILAGNNAFINRNILSCKLLVFIGIISYPLYLWHWPLLSFARIIYGEIPPRFLRYSIIFCAILLSILSYKIIETPLRRGGHGICKTFFLLFCMLTIGILRYKIYCQKLLMLSNQNVVGVIQDLDSNQDVYNKLLNDGKRCKKFFPKWGDSRELSPRFNSQCMFSNDVLQLNTAIIGDSHAGALYYGFRFINNSNVAVFPVANQAPFIDVKTKPDMWGNNDFHWSLINDAYNFVINHKNIKNIILVHSEAPSYEEIADIKNIKSKDNTLNLSNSLKRSLELLKKFHKNVIILLDNPHLDFEPYNKCKMRPIMRFLKSESVDSLCLDTFERKKYENKNFHIWYRSIVFSISQNYDNVFVYNAMDSLCGKKFCKMIEEDQPLYLDNNHLNYKGAGMVANDLLKLLQK